MYRWILTKKWGKRFESRNPRSSDMYMNLNRTIEKFGWIRAAKLNYLSGEIFKNSSGGGINGRMEVKRTGGGRWIRVANLGELGLEFWNLGIGKEKENENWNG